MHDFEKGVEKMLSIPFTQEDLKALSGETLVISKNVPGNVVYQKVSEKKMTAPGRIRGGRVEIVDGMLSIYDGDGLWCHFNSVEWNGSSQYWRGFFDREMDGISRTRHNATLHLKREYGLEPFGVCISTCREYAETTMPVLLKSLVMAGIKSEQIVAVIGGDIEDSEADFGNIRTLTRIQSENGYNGLMGADSRYKYWLLVEDTSIVEQDITDRIRSIDIGLSPDVVMAANDSPMGFYSSDFLNRINGCFRSNGIKASVGNGVRTSFLYGGVEKDTEPRDIYGKGIRRSTRNMPIGIQKYDSRTLSRKWN